MKPTRDDWEYYEKRIDASGDCWQWTGSVDAVEGYGRGRRTSAHREVWMLLVGPIPKGHEVDHLCKNRPCVNPDHLEPVTRQENARRSVNKQAIKTHCKRGHEFTDENTRIYAGARHCRACNATRLREYRAEGRPYATT